MGKLSLIYLVSVLHSHLNTYTVQALNPGHAFRLSGLFCPQLLVIDNTLGVDALNMTRRFPPTRGFLSHFS